MVKLTCNSCGGKLEITEDIERFACGHCGTEWIVNRGGGIVSLKGIENKLDKIEKHTSENKESAKILANEAKLRLINEDIKNIVFLLNNVGKQIEDRLRTVTEEIAKIENLLDIIELYPQKKNPKRFYFLIFIVMTIAITIAIIYLFFQCDVDTFFNVFSFINKSILKYLLYPVLIGVLMFMMICLFQPDFICDEELKACNEKQFRELEAKLINLKSKKLKIEDEIKSANEKQFRELEAKLINLKSKKLKIEDEIKKAY